VVTRSPARVPLADSLPPAWHQPDVQSLQLAMSIVVLISHGQVIWSVVVSCHCLFPSHRYLQFSAHRFCMLYHITRCGACRHCLTAAVSRGLVHWCSYKLTDTAGDGSMWSTASAVKLSLDERPVNSPVYR